VHRGRSLRVAASTTPAVGLPASPLIMPSRKTKKGRSLNNFDQPPRQLGIIRSYRKCPALRRESGLEDKLPHHSTLQKFSARCRVLEIADHLIQGIGQAAAAVAPIWAGRIALCLLTRTEKHRSRGCESSPQVRTKQYGPMLRIISHPQGFSRHGQHLTDCRSESID
jgi:hypothetical protein